MVLPRLGTGCGQGGSPSEIFSLPARVTESRPLEGGAPSPQQTRTREPSQINRPF
jgi:hypothetical protein